MFLYYILGLILGLIVGFTVTRVFNMKQKIWGYLTVDQRSNQVKVHLNPADFKDGKAKRVLLDIIYGTIPERIEDEDTRE